MAYLNGRIGQVLGPFESNDLLDNDGAIGAFTPETTRPTLTKLGIQTEPGVVVKINNIPIRIGGTGMYELDNVIAVHSIVFPNGAPEDTQIDFVY